jgi:hypothetical protein
VQKISHRETPKVYLNPPQSESVFLSGGNSVAKHCSRGCNFSGRSQQGVSLESRRTLVVVKVRNKQIRSKSNPETNAAMPMFLFKPDVLFKASGVRLQRNLREKSCEVQGDTADVEHG